MRGDADEGEVLLDVGCDTEGEVFLPGCDVVFGGEVVEEGTVGGYEGGGFGGHSWGYHSWDMGWMGGVLCWEVGLLLFYIGDWV